MRYKDSVAALAAIVGGLGVLIPLLLLVIAPRGNSHLGRDWPVQVVVATDVSHSMRCPSTEGRCKKSVREKKITRFRRSRGRAA